MIIDGKKCATKILETIFAKVKKLPSAPKIVFLLVGENPASQLYVKKKKQTCEKLSLQSEVLRFSEKVTQKEILLTLQTLNKDPSVHAILVQMPLPKTLNPYEIIEAIDPKKDVDGFHPLNLGRLLQGNRNALAPCTPLAVQYLLKIHKVDLTQKEVVIIGRSNVVGKPLMALLVQNHPDANATVTLCHSKTPNLSFFTRKAEVLICATGKAKMITATMVKKGAVVIDVGISRYEGKLSGDVDFEAVKEKASLITPVPGGVGPMTIAMLMQNTLLCYEKQRKST